MLKIGIDIRNIGKKRTGDEVVFFNLVKNLAEIDNKNKYYLFTDIVNDDDLADIEEKLAIKYKNNFKIVSLVNKNKFVWNLWTLPQYLQKNKIDIYHTQYIVPFRMPKGVKIITHIHDISFNFYPQFIKKSDLFFLKILIPWSIRKADKVIAVSEFTKKEIVNYYKTPEDKIEVVYNALAPEFITFSKKEVRPSEDRTSISEDDLQKVIKKYNLPEKYLLYVGTFQPRKNIPFLIEAFSRVVAKATLRGDLEDIKLVLVGDRKAHNYDTRIDEKIKKYNLADSIIFPGYVDEDDKAAVYQNSLAFIFPSLYEGFGIPIVEAMAQGVPVLASNISVLKEIGWEAVLFFKRNSLDDFPKKMYDIIMNLELRKELIEKGKLRVKDFSWQDSAKKLLEVYEQVVKSCE